MTHFPNPISLPESVPQARKDRNKQVVDAAKWGIIIRLFVILMELLGFYWFASSALLMDAISSSLDIVTSSVLIVCIKLAARPPDEDHPFGHGRYEPLAGLQLGMLLLFVGSGMIIQQLSQLFEVPEGKVIDPNAWIIPLFAMIMLEICYQIMIRVAKRKNSPALAADAVHYRVDGLTSLFATIALIAAAFFPEWSIIIDHFGAIVIAILMVGLGINAIRNNLSQLMDKAPHSDYFECVRKAARRVKDVLDTEKIRIQIYGPDAHVDIDVEVDPQLPVETAHKISQQVRAEIQKEWPSVRDVTVHIEPYYPDDH
jgi:cation diffusion facilitator family transporter